MAILKNQISSNLGLKGETPSLRAGADTASQLHYFAKSKKQTPTHSVHDLDGETPESYTNPEK